MQHNFYDISFLKSIEKLKSYKLTELNKFDSFLYEIADIVFDIVEIIELKKIDLRRMPNEYSAKLNSLLTEMKELDKLLAKMNYDSHAHDRFINVFYALWTDLEKELSFE